MGRFTTFIGALVLVIAACSGSASPAATPGPATATPASAAPAPTEAASMAPIAVTVTWDGKTCTYSGPAVVPLGSTAVFTLVDMEREKDSSMAAANSLVVNPVVDGTTWEQALDYAANHGGAEPPPWARIPGAGPDGLAETQSLLSPIAAEGGTLTVRFTRNAYEVACHTSPWTTDKAYPAILLQVMKG